MNTSRDQASTAAPDYLISITGNRYFPISNLNLSTFSLKPSPLCCHMPLLNVLLQLSCWLSSMGEVFCPLNIFMACSGLASLPQVHVILTFSYGEKGFVSVTSIILHTTRRVKIHSFLFPFCRIWLI